MSLTSESMAPDSFGRSPWFRGGLVVATLGLLPLLWSVVGVAAASVPWNPARLAPSFALAYGLPIYALRDSGQQLGWFYGPGFPLWNLPATLSSHPTHALLIAAGWNVLTWLVPVALVLRAAQVARGWWAAGGAVYMGVLMLGNPVTNYGLYFIHVDALCLAAGLTACVVVHRAANRGSDGWLHLAALGVAVAFWTKQISCVLGLAMLIWLWREGYRRQFWRLAFLGFFWAALLSLAVFSYFGAEEIIFNGWLVHSRNPWRGGAGLLLEELARLAAAFWAWLPLVALMVWWRRVSPATRMQGGTASLVRLLVWAAVVQLPFGLVALLKAGGGLNSLHSVHYLALALLVAAFQAFAQPRPDRLATWIMPGLWWMAAVIMPLGCAADIALKAGKVRYDYQALVEMARAQPGRYYFPWNPLVTLIVERRIQPLDDALYCLWLARLEPPLEKIRSAVPAEPIILYQEPAQSHFALRYFPRPKDDRPSSGP